MGHVILGLLLIRPMSQYDLIRAFERSISLFYSASSGSIRRALVLLAESGAIVETGIGSRRGRREWAITPVGRAEFERWMSSVPDGGEREVLARLYFLGLMPAAARGPILDRLTAAVDREAARLDALAEVQDDVAAELADVVRFQLATLEMGKAQAAAATRVLADVRRRSEEAGEGGPATP